MISSSDLSSELHFLKSSWKPQTRLNSAFPKSNFQSSGLIPKLISVFRFSVINPYFHLSKQLCGSESSQYYRHLPLSLTKLSNILPKRSVHAFPCIPRRVIIISQSLICSAPFSILSNHFFTLWSDLHFPPKAS